MKAKVPSLLLAFKHINQLKGLTLDLQPNPPSNLAFFTLNTQITAFHSVPADMLLCKCPTFVAAPFESGSLLS